MGRGKNTRKKGVSGDPRVRNVQQRANPRNAATSIRGPVGQPGGLQWPENIMLEAIQEEGGEPFLLSAEQNELYTTLGNVLARIRDHVRRMDEGLAYAVDDLAVALRVLLHKGRGGRLLMRTIDAFELDTPSVLVSGLPQTGAVFSVGGIPIIPNWDGVLTDAHNLVTLPDFLELPVIRMRLRGEDRVIKWGEFIALVANKLGGAHSDDVIPEELDAIDRFVAGGLALSGYLLQQVAFVAWHFGQDVLRACMTQAGMDVREEHYFGPRGADLSQPPEDVPQGWLAGFVENEREVHLVWYVDERSPDNSLRLVFFGAVWDFTWTPSEGLQVEKPSDANDRAFQVQRRVVYADQGDESIHDVEGSREYWYVVRTLDDLEHERPFEFGLDYNPWIPGPGWDLITPSGELISGDLSMIEFGKAAGLLVPRGPKSGDEDAQ